LAITVSGYAGREPPEIRVVILQGDADLVQVVSALGAGGGLADFLHGGQQQANQDRNDRDHHQQLDQREAATLALMGRHGILLENPCGESFNRTKKAGSCK
jgi:hypothetical protein